MTQPVQEPTQGRLDAGQEFRTRQLYRRPSPGGGLAGNWANVRRTTDFTLGASSSDFVPWTYFRTSDNGSDVFATSDTAGLAINNTSGDQYVVLQAPGAYVVTAEGRFTVATTDGRILIETGAVSNLGGSHPDADWGAVVAAGTGWMRDTTVIVVDSSALQYFVVRAFNADGVSRDLRSCYVMVAYIPTQSGEVVIF